MNINPQAPPAAIFRPKFLLAGLILGLVACALTARIISHRGYHEKFTRFHVKISPEANYYPTLEEMCGIVRARCRPDQVLVIIGGNSILHGVGQPADRMWTVELQRLLGERFVVINFAFRGALCTDGGAVVAEVLRYEYPQQIYVANAAPFNLPAPYGLEPYRYLFWSAHNWGLLEDFAPRNELVAEFLQTSVKDARQVEIRGADLLDQVLRFRDFWNWVGYQYFFTIQSPHTPDFPSAIWARKKFRDKEDNFDEQPSYQGSTFASTAIEMGIVRGFTSLFYQRVDSDGWKLNPQSWDAFLRVARGAIPDDLKARTLIMLGRNSPYYLKNLTADEMARDNLAYQDGAAAWRAAGYMSAEYGRDFEARDYGDRAHLTAAGGRKLAAVVAAKVQDMAKDFDYMEVPLKWKK